jgi:hypothetical protein
MVPAMSQPQDSGRRAKRVSVDSMVLVRSVTTDRVFRTRDLSETGAFIFTKVTAGNSFEVGQAVELQLTGTIDGRAVAVRCGAEIVRAVAPGTTEERAFPTGLGVRITSCDPANRALLDRLLAQRAN